MPFVKEKFVVPKEMPAFSYIMRTFNLTQAKAQSLINRGRLLINGESMFRPGTKIIGEIEIVYFKPSAKNHRPLFQNNDLMIFEKPSGVLVHPKTMSTPYSMLDEIRHTAGDDANAIHRIDKETSGLLLASKHKASETYLKNAFEAKTIQKSYLAWVDGKVAEPFSVSKAIKVNNNYSQTKHKVFIDDTGRYAHTEFEPIYYDEKLDASLLACYPITGRTHQIRVHLFHVKHPILGDPIYGTSFEASNDYLDEILSPQDRLIQTGASRLMLHAQSLHFNYGSTFYLESKTDFKQMKNFICEKEKRRFNRP
ncbi:MAG: RluA family pseudouridine synthase [Campylobacterales bacterium]|nr:RluA family pseudouridine synthase [Campylobacterales bacterium]